VAASTSEPVISVLASVNAAAAFRTLLLCFPANTAAAAAAPASSAAATASRATGDSIASENHSDFGRKLDHDELALLDRLEEPLFFALEPPAFFAPRDAVLRDPFELREADLDDLRACFAMASYSLLAGIA